MTRLFAVLIFSVLLSCERTRKTITIKRINDLVLIDTSYEPKEFLEIKAENCYPIFYMGLKEDTIKISDEYSVKKPNWKTYNNLNTAHTINANNLSLYVDTNCDLNSPMEYSTQKGIINKDSTKNYHSYLLVLTNLGDSTLNLGITFYLIRAYREVMNKNGEWVEIDKRDASLYCGTGQPEIILFKNDILLSKIRRYYGDTIAAFRMTYEFSNQKVHSNIFHDKFDKRFL